MVFRGRCRRQLANADRWSIVGAYYYDTNANKQADSIFGVQYSSCCYAIRVGYERKLNDLG